MIFFIAITEKLTFQFTMNKNQSYDLFIKKYAHVNAKEKKRNQTQIEYRYMPGFRLCVSTHCFDQDRKKINLAAVIKTLLRGKKMISLSGAVSL